MNAHPYRDAPEMDAQSMDVHVSNAAHVVVAAQREGWQLVGALNLFAGQFPSPMLQRLTFNRRRAT